MVAFVRPDACWRCLQSLCLCLDCDGRILTTIHQVEDLRRQNCTVIVGPLIVQELQSEGYEHRPSLDTIIQITQFLVIQRLNKHYTSISQLLPNLAAIRGYQLLDGQWGLAVMDNPFLTDLGWSPLPVIREGNALVVYNPQLRETTISSLTLSFQKSDQDLVDFGVSLRTSADSCWVQCAYGDTECETEAQKCLIGNDNCCLFETFDNEIS